MQLKIKYNKLQKMILKF